MMENSIEPEQTELELINQLENRSGFLANPEDSQDYPNLIINQRQTPGLSKNTEEIKMKKKDDRIFSDLEENSNRQIHQEENNILNKFEYFSRILETEDTQVPLIADELQPIWKEDKKISLHIDKLNHFLTNQKQNFEKEQIQIQPFAFDWVDYKNIFFKSCEVVDKDEEDPYDRFVTVDQQEEEEVENLMGFSLAIYDFVQKFDFTQLRENLLNGSIAIEGYLGSVWQESNPRENTNFIHESQVASFNFYLAKETFSIFNQFQLINIFFGIPSLKLSQFQSCSMEEIIKIFIYGLKELDSPSIELKRKRGIKIWLENYAQAIAQQKSDLGDFNANSSMLGASLEESSINLLKSKNTELALSMNTQTGFSKIFKSSFVNGQKVKLPEGAEQFLEGNFPFFKNSNFYFKKLSSVNFITGL